MLALKQRDLKKCVCCDRGLMHNNSITFTRLEIGQFIVNLPAVHRQHGFEMMMGGALQLAAVIGPDEDIAVSVSDSVDVLVCNECSMKHCLAELVERAFKGMIDSESAK